MTWQVLGNSRFSCLAPCVQYLSGMRYTAKELRNLAKHYGRTMTGDSIDGVRMEARRCPCCAAYEVIDVDACEMQPNHDYTILSCKCDI